LNRLPADADKDCEWRKTIANTAVMNQQGSHSKSSSNNSSDRAERIATAASATAAGTPAPAPAIAETTE
jgi:hypothetical protein